MSEIYSELESWFSNQDEENWRSSLATIIERHQKLFRPIWHPLGFIHVKMAENTNGDTFRLHLWTAEYHHSDEQSSKIHDHMFDIRSRVVFGAVKNTNYEFVSNDSGSFRVAIVNYLRNSSRLEETGFFGDITEVNSTFLVAPAEYRVPAFNLHETSTFNSNLSLTVVHTSHAAKYNPRALLNRNAPLPPKRDPIPCDRELWSKLLERIFES